MPVPRFLRPVAILLSWPGGRFREYRRRYDVALSPSDARAVVRGALRTDPLHLPVLEGVSAHLREDVVGGVDEDGRMEVYIGAKWSTGLGLVGRIAPHDEGSRISVRVGWTGSYRWGAALWAAILLVFGFGAYDLAVNEGRPYLAAITMVGVVVTRILLAFDAGRKARQRELPSLVAHLDRVLAPHLTERPPRG